MINLEIHDLPSFLLLSLYADIHHFRLQMINLEIHITVFAHFFSPDLYIFSLDSNSLKVASSMEEHLLYKQEVGGLIPSCPDIHMEWW